MSIAEIIRSGANVTLAVSANDLREWHKEVVEDAKRQLEESVICDKSEKYLSADKVCEMLDIGYSD